MMQDEHGIRKRLLPAVYELALRLGADPGRRRSAVRLGQTGRMRQLGASRWMAFRAEQPISLLRCAFNWRARTWRARTGPAGLVSVCDALSEGEGRLDVRALGFFPIARASSSPALIRGELMRYLAELAWAPDAILLNAELRWREGEPDTLVVGAGSGETAAEVVLSLDDKG